MIIREELQYNSTFIRGDILDFKKGYSKHGTFLKIKNKIIDCGYIEENSIGGTAFKFLTMGEYLSRENIVYQLKDLLKCKPRMYYLMTPEQKIDLAEAIKKRCEEKFEEALKLHINYCYNYMGRVEGEVFEELYKLLTSMGFYDLGLCFMALANLSEVQTYADDNILDYKAEGFANLKKVVEYCYGNELDVQKRDTLRGIVYEIAGKSVKINKKLARAVSFKSEDIIIEKKIENEEECEMLKYLHKDKSMYITLELLEELEKEMLEIYIDEQKIISSEGCLYIAFWKKVLEIKNN